MTPASIRNNNPGACEPGPSSRKFGSTSFETLRWKDAKGKERTNRIATFATPQHGAAAQFDLLHRKYTGKPLEDAVAMWCGGYWAGEYAKHVESACGMTGDQLLTQEAVRDPAKAVPIARAMARMEAGRDYPMDDAGWAMAHSMAFSGGLAPAPSTENDVPFQKPEGKTRDTVKSVAPAVAATATAASAIVPGVPDAVTSTLSAAASWQAAGDQLAGLIKWAFTSPMAMLVVALAACVLYLPKLVRH